MTEHPTIKVQIECMGGPLDGYIHKAIIRTECKQLVLDYDSDKYVALYEIWPPLHTNPGNAVGTFRGYRKF